MKNGDIFMHYTVMRCTDRCFHALRRTMLHCRFPLSLCSVLLLLDDRDRQLYLTLLAQTIKLYLRRDLPRVRKNLIDGLFLIAQRASPLITVGGPNFALEIRQRRLQKCGTASPITRPPGGCTIRGQRTLIGLTKRFLE